MAADWLDETLTITVDSENETNNKQMRLLIVMFITSSLLSPTCRNYSAESPKYYCLAKQLQQIEQNSRINFQLS